MTKEVHLLENYLKLLYSPNFASIFFSEEQSEYCELVLKPHINKERLAVEQYARLRNFIYHIQLSLTLVDNLLTKDELEAIISQFLNSQDFWVFKGRTLLENFCLFAYPYLSHEGQFFKAELIKLQGVVAGLMQTETMSSPWGNTINRIGQEVQEQFFSDYKLISDEGKVIQQLDYIPANSTPNRYRLTIIIKSTKKVRMICQPL